MIDKQAFQNLKVPMLPPNDTARMGGAALSAEYDEVAHAIYQGQIDVDKFLARAAAVNGDDVSKVEKELGALRVDALRLAVAAVETAEARENLRGKVRAAHSAHNTLMQKNLSKVEEEKKAKLREVNNGELPWGYPNIIDQATMAEREAAAWTPTLAMQIPPAPHDSPEAKARRTLQSLAVHWLGFDPNS